MKTIRRMSRRVGLHGFIPAAALLWTGQVLCAQDAPVVQAPVAAGGPIAIVPLDSKTEGSAALVTGALQVSHGRAVIAANGSVTAGADTTQVILPHRGMLRVCASTTVKLAADSSVPAGETPGLLIAMEHGALEMSFATSQAPMRDADILMTPEFRILINGPGAAEVKVRLGERGDTCVDNAGANAPYVLVSSVFDGGAYRVQPGQRVMFQHGSLHEVVDQEKESCGCPPAAPKGNEFPLAQSEGLGPSAPPALDPTQPQTSGTLAYNAANHEPQADDASQAQTNADSSTRAKPKKSKKKHGASPISEFFESIGHFFKRLFGAE
ncbi:MAG: hypothetical protein ABSD67_14155 [Terracidiphilus sp.]|jgi:hypothetical protein